MKSPCWSRAAGSCPRRLGGVVGLRFRLAEPDSLRPSRQPVGFHFVSGRCRTATGYDQNAQTRKAPVRVGWGRLPSLDCCGGASPIRDRRARAHSRRSPTARGSCSRDRPPEQSAGRPVGHPHSRQVHLHDRVGSRPARRIRCCSRTTGRSNSSRCSPRGRYRQWPTSTSASCSSVPGKERFDPQLGPRCLLVRRVKCPPLSPSTRTRPGRSVPVRWPTGAIVREQFLRVIG